MRPVCLNYGCESLVAVSSAGRHTAFCSACTLSNSTGKYKYGVLPFKTAICSNRDSHLGFPCPVDWDNLNESVPYKKLTEVDHIDGNRNHNTPSNIQELCPICHATKGHINKDQNPWKNYSS